MKLIEILNATYKEVINVQSSWLLSRADTITLKNNNKKKLPNPHRKMAYKNGSAPIVSMKFFTWCVPAWYVSQ